MKRVLLVSAYLLFLRKKETLLMKREIQIFTATSGEDALKLHGMHHFDLIVIDSKLEDMFGGTLCALIRGGKRFPLVPIVATCNDIPSSVERVERSGATLILIKPIDPIKFIETVGIFLEMELRRSKRVVLSVKVFCNKNNEEFLCTSHDISNTGILLETDYPLTLNSRIICQFTLPGICMIEVEGITVRLMASEDYAYLYGVQFVALPLSARKAIDRYIASIPEPTPIPSDVDSRQTPLQLSAQ